MRWLPSGTRNGLQLTSSPMVSLLPEPICPKVPNASSTDPEAESVDTRSEPPPPKQIKDKSSRIMHLREPATVHGTAGPRFSRRRAEAPLSSSQARNADGDASLQSKRHATPRQKPWAKKEATGSRKAGSNRAIGGEGRGDEGRGDEGRGVAARGLRVTPSAPPQQGRGPGNGAADTAEPCDNRRRNNRELRAGRGREGEKGKLAAGVSCVACGEGQGRPVPENSCRPLRDASLTETTPSSPPPPPAPLDTTNESRDPQGR